MFPFLLLIDSGVAHSLYNMELRFEQHFTLEEANALVPAVRRVFAHVHALLGIAGMEGRQPQSADGAQNGRPNGNGNGNGNGHHDGNADSGATAPKPSQYDALSWDERKQAASALLESLMSQGIVLQDFTRGLIDFPAIRDGREIFLCYELADGERIQFFHDLEAGFAGRQRL